MKKYQVLYQQIKQDIESGLLKEGERLRSIREEAVFSGLSINTVISAYNLLTDQGLVRARERGGYYVRIGIPDLTSTGMGNAASHYEKYSDAAVKAGARLDCLYERLVQIDASFASAAPGLDILPAGQLSRIASGLSKAWMAYGAPEGDPALRRRIAIASQQADKNVSPDDIVVTNGGTEALSIVLRTLLKPGDIVALESPTYMNFFRQLAPLGVRIVEIPVSEEGIDLNILEEELKRQAVRMIIVQPNVQNPTGITMGEAAKKGLVYLAEKSGSYLVQDDVFGDLHFGSCRPKNLSFYSDYPGLILVSSYSKSVSPGLRVGWIWSRYHCERFAEEKLHTSMENCRISQAVLSAFIGTAAHRRHLRALRKVLESRIIDHIRYLSEILPLDSSIRRPDGGCLLWVAFPSHINATALFEHAAGKGLIGTPGALFSASHFFDHCLRLNAGMRLTRERASTLSFIGEASQKKEDRFISC